MNTPSSSSYSYFLAFLSSFLKRVRFKTDAAINSTTQTEDWEPVFISSKYSSLMIIKSHSNVHHMHMFLQDKPQRPRLTTGVLNDKNIRICMWFYSLKKCSDLIKWCLSVVFWWLSWGMNTLMAVYLQFWYFIKLTIKFHTNFYIFCRWGLLLWTWASCVWMNKHLFPNNSIISAEHTHPDVRHDHTAWNTQ